MQYVLIFDSLLNAYTSLIHGANLGKWQSRLTDSANSIVAFLTQATEIMYKAFSS